VDEDRRAWLHKLDEAAQRALDDLRPLDDPLQRDLISDLEAFKERIAAELAASPEAQ
jgi:hypothetical protein